MDLGAVIEALNGLLLRECLNEHLSSACPRLAGSSRGMEHRLRRRPAEGLAWNMDPVSVVIGVQGDPRDDGVPIPRRSHTLAE